MGVSKSEHGGFGVASRDKVEEGESSCFGVELSRKTDGFDLTVGAERR